MKSLFFLLITLFLCCACKKEDDDPQPTGPATLAEAITWVTPSPHDFGTIKKGETASFNFVFHNISNVNVFFSEAQFSCTCISTDFYKNLVPPGENGVVCVSINIPSKGAFNKAITMVSSVSNERVILIVKGEVVDLEASNQDDPEVERTSMEGIK